MDVGDADKLLFQFINTCRKDLNFFPSNAFLRKKALLRVNDRGWLENAYTSFMSCVCVCVYVCVRALMSHARLQLTYVAMAILRKQSQFMI